MNKADFFAKVAASAPANMHGGLYKSDKEFFRKFGDYSIMILY